MLDDLSAGALLGVDGLEAELEREQLVLLVALGLLPRQLVAQVVDVGILLCFVGLVGLVGGDDLVERGDVCPAPMSPASTVSLLKSSSRRTRFS